MHTNNLIIKKPSEKHLNALIKELNNWNISKWLIEVPYPYSIDDAKYWLKKTKQEWTYEFFYPKLVKGEL